MPLDGVKNIILVLSGKGGVGKSSVTLQLALTLSLQGRSVGILDVDLTGPSIPRLVGLEDAKITQAPGGWLPVTVHPARTTSPSDGSESKQPAGEIGDSNGSSSSTTVNNTQTPITPRGSLRYRPWCDSSSRTSYGERRDYLLIDTPPGTSDEHIALAEQLLTIQQASASHSSSAASPGPRLAGAVLVTTPQAISTADVRKEINFCVKTRIPILGVIENMSGYTCPCCGEVSNVFSRGGGQVMAQETGVRFLGAVPIDVGFGEMVEGWKEDLGKEDREKESMGDGQDAGHRVIDALLVDRYTKCWSFSIFEGFAKKLVELAEGTE
ncbi:nucleotide-binding protein 1 [Uncinocarpus reesii 1704]|uniref:Nucleotide-binding protein 1 n=1 Tax=Uncinocarpus reesii (strain UAMH 1704) TaxID=336963 RepID=C4JM11_UNCRE|nr:nucleotide-binding protein 1 [Uncinocarpus reesii 1704]EEP79023.1 nucleotide-binding protein 1 [Uncinocarpus reesii 1704]